MPRKKTKTAEASAEKETGSLIIQDSCAQPESYAKHTLLLKFLICFCCVGVREMGVDVSVSVCHLEVDIRLLPQ